MTFVEYEHEYEYEESVRYIVTRMGPGGEGSAGRKEAHKLCGHPHTPSQAGILPRNPN